MTHPETTTPANPAQVTVDALAQEIRRVDGNHDLGAGALAEALMPFLAAAIGAGRSSEPEFETAPDNGTPAEVLAYVLECARRWVPEARIIGNARAGDIERAIAAMGADGQAGALEPGTIRICPPRDRPCPHGLDCPYVDGYNCTDPSLSAKEGLERQIAELRAGNERLNRELNASQMQEIIGIERFLAAEVDKARLGRLLDAALSGSGADAGDLVQTGWRLVPEKLTDAMVRELERGEQDGYSVVWPDVLSAAPQPKGE